MITQDLELTNFQPQTNSKVPNKANEVPLTILLISSTSRSLK